MEVAGQAAFLEICDESEIEGIDESPEAAAEPIGEEDSEESSACLPRAVAELRVAEEEEEVARGEKTAGREPITITPVGSGTSAESIAIADENAAIAANTSNAVDTFTRPLADGGVDFADIRSASAPEHYAFEIESYTSELELRQVSPQVITAFYREGRYSAFTLEAEPASDAAGHAVPTHLTLNGPKSGHARRRTQGHSR
jgi:hypothetical protein